MGLQTPNVSTLADVFRLVSKLFSLAGDGTPLFFGLKFLDNLGPGSAPRIVFVPDEEGSLAGPLKISAGYVASWTHGCTVHVLGVEPGDDEGRFEPAYALAARVVTAIKALDPAHLVVAPGRPKDVSPLKVGAPGSAISFSFSYQTNIAQDAAILAAAKQLTAISPPDPDRPQGDTGNTFTLDTTATPTAARN